MAEDAHRISEAEYEKWLSPRQALERLEVIGRDLAIEAIVGWIRTGSIEAVARRFTHLENSMIKKADAFVRMRTAHWIEHATDAFWATGELVLFMNLNGVEAELRHNGIRLGKGFEALEAQVLPANVHAKSTTFNKKTRTPSAKIEKLPLIPDAKLKSWLATRQRSPHRILKRDAEAKFPANRIGKNQLYRVMRDVYGPLSIGNPSISH